MARLFVDNLSVIDFSYLDSQRGVVGESWIVDIELIGSLDDQGMVFDFGKTKKQIKQFIDAEVDHRLLVPVASSNCLTRLDHDELFVEFPLATGGMISHQSPRDAVLLVDAETIQTQTIANELQVRIKSILPDNIAEVRVNLRSEAVLGAYYHYTHGLQKHLGQCQRIAHGHRSQIEIQIDGQRNAQVEAQWADRLKDSYIATESHIIKKFERDGILHTELAYTAEQGYFAISLPSAKVFIMPMESTVENLAIYFSKLIAKENKAGALVKAYEGVGKGAFGETSGVKNKTH